MALEAKNRPRKDNNNRGKEYTVKPEIFKIEEKAAIVKLEGDKIEIFKKKKNTTCAPYV